MCTLYVCISCAAHLRPAGPHGDSVTLSNLSISRQTITQAAPKVFFRSLLSRVLLDAVAEGLDTNCLGSGDMFTNASTFLCKCHNGKCAFYRVVSQGVQFILHLNASWEGLSTLHARHLPSVAVMINDDKWEKVMLGRAVYHTLSSLETQMD